MNAKSLSPSQGGKLFEVDRMSAGAALREVGIRRSYFACYGR